MLNRSLRKVRTSKAVGRIGKDRILQIVLSVSAKLPELFEINNRLDIKWSGRFALDATHVRFQGQGAVVLLWSDFESLDVVDYEVVSRENYYTWRNFILKAVKRNNIRDVTKFFVTDGKRGLKQALSELFPNVPQQSCISHKLRRVHNIIPHIRGEGYDKLFARLAQLAINAPLEEIFNSCLNILLDFKNSTEFLSWPEPRQNKLKKVIGTLRFQKSNLHARYRYPELFKSDITTNHLEGINDFLKERLKLMRGIKSPKNLLLHAKILIYYYRFHLFTASRFKERNGKSPVSLNVSLDEAELVEINQGDHPYSWIINLLKST